MEIFILTVINIENNDVWLTNRLKCQPKGLCRNRKTKPLTNAGNLPKHPPPSTSILFFSL